MAAVYCHGVDGEVIAENCALSGLEMPFPPSLFLDVKPLMADKGGYALHSRDSSDLLETFGLGNGTQAHRAINDARGVAQVVAHLAAQG